VNCYDSYSHDIYMILLLLISHDIVMSQGSDSYVNCFGLDIGYKGRGFTVRLVDLIMSAQEDASSWADIIRQGITGRYRTTL